MFRDTCDEMRIAQVGRPSMKVLLTLYGGTERGGVVCDRRIVEGWDTKLRVRQRGTMRRLRAHTPAAKFLPLGQTACIRPTSLIIRNARRRRPNGARQRIRHHPFPRDYLALRFRGLRFPHVTTLHGRLIFRTWSPGIESIAKCLSCSLSRPAKTVLANGVAMSIHGLPGGALPGNGR